MFTGCVPGSDGEQVPAERIVPDAKEYILEAIDDPEAIYDCEIWDTLRRFKSEVQQCSIDDMAE